MANFAPSIQQQAIFDFVSYGRGSAIVNAKAGAGKTTTMVHAAELMVGSCYLAAYNTKMGAELRQRTSHLQNVKAGTFHAAGMNTLRRAITIKGDPDGKKVLTLIDAYIKAKGRMDLQPLDKTVAACVSMAKQRGIGVPGLFEDRVDVWEDMIWHFGLEEDLPECADEEEERKQLGKVIAFSAVILRASNRAAQEHGLIDFDDMIYLPLLWNLRFWQNDWVVVDEAQDTNPTRRAMARRMLKPNGRLIAVGDPNQAIYGFSGADNDSLEQIARDFDAVELGLSVTYRCPKAVVRQAQVYVPDIEAHGSAPEGIFRAIGYDTILEEVRPGDMILCRYNKYLVSLAFKLIRNGRPARIEGRAIGAGLVALANKWKSQNLGVLQTNVVKWIEREEKKALDAKKDAKADQIRDRGETLLVLIERALEQGINDVAGLRKMIADVFDDRVVDNKNMITLCSAHRSKGLEFHRVFILGLNELMGRQCRQEWQTQQEINLQYVAVTRAMGELIDVFGVKEEPRREVA